MTWIRELEDLAEMHDSGVLSDEEFALAKARVLNAGVRSPSSGPFLPRQIHGMREETWLSLMHLSQLAGYVVIPVVGIVAPVVMWALSRECSPRADRHGRLILNWLLTSLLLGGLAGLLIPAVVGVPLLAAVVILDFIFPIIAFAKTQKGEEWRYPFSIEFLRVERQHSTAESIRTSAPAL